jgi:hypothetical protein
MILSAINPESWLLLLITVFDGSGAIFNLGTF